MEVEAPIIIMSGGRLVHRPPLHNGITKFYLGSLYSVEHSFEGSAGLLLCIIIVESLSFTSKAMQSVVLSQIYCVPSNKEFVLHLVSLEV